MTSSIAPFPTATADEPSSLTTAARLLTRTPFAPCKEDFAPLPAIDDTTGFPTTPTERLLQLGLCLTEQEIAELLSRPAVSTDCYAPTTLHRRDRSVYAWFETVGITLTILAVSLACAALLIG
jgi:hypothetical protein